MMKLGELIWTCMACSSLLLDVYGCESICGGSGRAGVSSKLDSVLEGSSCCLLN